MRALVNLIEKYRPGFTASVVPAAEEEIELIEEFVRPLPGSYRRFLETMGGGMGGFRVNEATFAPMDIWAAYKAMKWLRRDRFVLVAMDEGLGAWDYYLDRESPHGKDDFMMVRMRLEEEFDPVNRMISFAGLEEMLYYKAYATIRLPLLANLVRLGQPDDPQPGRSCRPEDACALAEELGFKRIPPATRCALYERGDAAILLFQDPIKPLFSFDLACDDGRELERMADIFRRRAGVEIMKSPRR